MTPALSPLKSVGLRTLATLAVLFPAIAASSELDIGGLRLGMTPDEARQALVEFGVAADKIQESRSKFWFMDGDKRHETPDFIDRMYGTSEVFENGKRVQRVGDSIELDFSPPPEGGRVVRITRTVVNFVDAPTVGSYRNALIEKYGPPDQTISSNPIWMRGPGKADCVTGAKGKGADAYVNAIYRRIQGRVSFEHLTNPRNIKGPDDCAIRLIYKLGSGDHLPAKRVTAELIDPGTWVKAQLAAMAVIDKQKTEAVKARDAGADKPKL